MTLSMHSRMSILIPLVALLTILAGVPASLGLRGTLPHAHARAADATPTHIDCTKTATCLDPLESEQLGEGQYVGHDEPSNLFYSHVPGAGNRNLWFLKLPTSPTPGPGGVPLTGQSFDFQLHPAFWFGMAMCDTQSYPEQVSTCTPDSDTNIVDPAVSANHPGTAFMEMQFYPPGWVEWPASAVGAAGTSCDPTRWCAALNIDSLSQNGVTGQFNNAACLAAAGAEYVNFAFITKNGVATGPASPLLSTLGGTFTPDANRDLFMNSGDQLAVVMRDTSSGLRIDIVDLTTHQHGFMVASASNGFGEVLYDPNGNNCNPATHNIPTNFHPMYSTSSPATRVIWAAHSYNIAFSDEIGHFDSCNGGPTIPATLAGASCPAGNFEGVAGDQEPTDIEDNFCFPASRSSFLQINGCTDTNNGFDGVPYQNNAWPDGNPDHPTPIQFTSPLTGLVFNRNYTTSAFETDLPRIEAATPGSSNNCQRSGPNAGNNCFLLPLTDDSRTPPPTGDGAGLIHAPFYPYYSSTTAKIQFGHFPSLFTLSTCVWQIGGAIPNSNLFGQNAQYGQLLTLHYLPIGRTRINDFQGVQTQNPCPTNRFAGILAILLLKD